MTPKRQYQTLEKLAASEGWAVLRQTMEREIVDAALAIANSPNMTLDEINFRRGSIWAAHQLIGLPERLLHRLKSDLALEHSKTKADAATAA